MIGVCGGSAFGPLCMHTTCTEHAWGGLTPDLKDFFGINRIFFLCASIFIAYLSSLARSLSELHSDPMKNLL